MAAETVRNWATGTELHTNQKVCNSLGRYVMQWND
jgi:hypothetical protein